MIRFFAILGALLLAAFISAPPAAAHQQKLAISSVAHNPRTDMIEVVHRIPLHDAEHALKQQGVTAPDIIADLESRRAFARYAGRRFSVSVDGTPISFTLLGTEIEGANLMV